MNWETIKHIYRCVLVYNYKIEYFGNDEYILTEYYPNGNKYWEARYKNGKPHGKIIKWIENEKKHFSYEYENGKLVE